jgi:hypothetical protein
VKALKLLGVAAVLIPLGVVVALILDHGKPDGATAAQAAAAQAAAIAAEPLRDPDLGGLCVAAQMYIEDRLKSPGSGSFDICRILSISADKKTAFIDGNFTATNAFNAKIRSSYTATLVRKPGAPAREDKSDTWRIASLQTEN